ncbi:hypothetical protein MSAN_01497600 [Mycena sanguinolenta]|uniref:Uncharacterized protein n=1 Tax=Mycena sanguinolenta TaxID=230812 RepID=A0A8H7CYZ9_9AGAR|nr:hypothetical protein MSAN_01497600 [Mycena sanguinolenta]
MVEETNAGQVLVIMSGDIVQYDFQAKAASFQYPWRVAGKHRRASYGCCPRFDLLGTTSDFRFFEAVIYILCIQPLPNRAGTSYGVAQESQSGMAYVVACNCAGHVPQIAGMDSRCAPTCLELEVRAQVKAEVGKVEVEKERRRAM